MEDKKLKSVLKQKFDSFETEPNDAIFSKINDQINQHYLSQKLNNGRKYYLIFGLLSLFLGGYFWTVNSTKISLISAEKISKENLKGNELIVSSNIENENKFYKKVNNKSHIKTLNIKGLEYNREVLEPENIKIEAQIKTYSSIKNNNKYLQSEPKNFDTKIPEISSEKTEISKVANSIWQNLPVVEESIFTNNQDSKKLYLNDYENKHISFANYNFLKPKKGDFLSTNFTKYRFFALNKSRLPKKELPKINKTTPLAMEFGINPFYGFQKISATELGMANIQNISRTKLSNQQRLGFTAHANYVINWTKQSRLRVGLSYRDILQSVDYEKATDIFEFQTVNGNQTVLVRKGLPYSENKRNQMIGLKADRQFFLQLSTPTRFYASLGAEYTKSLNKSGQMLFVNSTMGLDMPLKAKWKLQIEPSYSYAILGTTDANKFVNINPNHLGIKVGLLYLIRE